MFFHTHALPNSDINVLHQLYIVEASQGQIHPHMLRLRERERDWLACWLSLVRLLARVMNFCQTFHTRDCHRIRLKVLLCIYLHGKDGPDRVYNGLLFFYLPSQSYYGFYFIDFARNLDSIIGARLLHVQRRRGAGHKSLCNWQFNRTHDLSFEEQKASTSERGSRFRRVQEEARAEQHLGEEEPWKGTPEATGDRGPGRSTFNREQPTARAGRLPREGTDDPERIVLQHRSFSAGRSR